MLTSKLKTEKSEPQEMAYYSTLQSMTVSAPAQAEKLLKSPFAPPPP